MAPILWTTFRKALTADPAVIESLQNRTANLYQPLGGSNVTQQMQAAFQRAQAATYAFMYMNQPAVRSVVDLIAENISQLGLKLYERVSETEREPDTEHPAALTMRYPNDATPADLFIFEIAADYLVYDNFYVLKFPRGPNQPMSLIRLLPHMVGVLGQGYAVTGYRVYRSDGSSEDFPPDRMMHARRYNPDDARVGISRLETLRAELTEDAAIQTATTEMARNGLRGDYIKRPLEADVWSAEARENFVESWRNRRRGSPTHIPVLEEGMEVVNSMISPKDAELLSARQATKESVAQVYGVPVGLLTGEGDQTADAKRFYKDVLAPVSRKIACQLDHSIVQGQYMATDRYFEFNLDEKLRGDAEARFPAQTATVGRPWRTVNEARASENLPSIDGGDALTIPLNVMLEGEGSPALPAPNVMPPQQPGKPEQDGSYREQPAEGQSLNGHGKAVHLIPRRVGLESRRTDDAKLYESVVRRHFERQRRTMKRQEKAAAGWDAELADDLYRLSRTTVRREGEIAAARMMSRFNTKETPHWLAAKAEGAAQGINAATEKRIAVLGVDEAFKEALDWRAAQEGATYATALFAFSAKEALEQVADPAGRMVTVSGGECEICAPYQGVWRPDDLDEWPSYHPSCQCIAEVG